MRVNTGSPFLSRRPADADWPASMPVFRAGRADRLVASARARAMAVRRAEAPVPAGALVRGATVGAIHAALGPFRARAERVLAEHGIREVESEEWYPLRTYLEALRTVRDTLGPNTLLQIGKQVPRHAPCDADPEGTLDGVLQALEACFAANHRGVEPGAFSYRVTSHRTALVTSRSAYPCDFVRGVLQGFFHAYLGARVEVAHQACGCKDDGGEACTYVVSLPLA